MDGNWHPELQQIAPPEKRERIAVTEVRGDGGSSACQLLFALAIVWSCLQ